MILMLFKQQKQINTVPFHEFHVLIIYFCFRENGKREKMASKDRKSEAKSYLPINKRETQIQFIRIKYQINQKM